MFYLLVRWAILALAVSATSWLLPGFTIHQGWQGLIIVSGLLGIVNAIIRPIVMVLTCPLVILTLGLFAVVINALMLSFVAWLLPAFVTLDSFWTTLVASILISIAATIMNTLVHD
jgi:putative membrane protein